MTALSEVVLLMSKGSVSGEAGLFAWDFPANKRGLPISNSRDMFPA
jgi:hypothetical protein